jgi:hypothetical protein
MNTNQAVPPLPNIHPEGVVPQPALAPNPLDIAAPSPLNQENIDSQEQIASEPLPEMQSTEAAQIPVVENPGSAEVAPQVPTDPVISAPVLPETIQPTVPPTPSVQAKIVEPATTIQVAAKIVDTKPGDLAGLAALADQVGRVKSEEPGE